MKVSMKHDRARQQPGRWEDAVQKCQSTGGWGGGVVGRVPSTRGTPAQRFARAPTCLTWEALQRTPRETWEKRLSVCERRGGRHAMARSRTGTPVSGR